MVMPQNPYGVNQMPPMPMGAGVPPMSGMPQQWPASSPMGMPPFTPAPIPDIKWSNLSTGGAFKIPIGRFIGKLNSVGKDFDQKHGNMYVVFNFTDFQILEANDPWQQPVIPVRVKYADSTNSSWGRTVESAKRLGLAKAAGTLDEALGELVGRWYEMSQTFNESFGEDAQGKTLAGNVWRFFRIVDPTQVFAQPPQYAQPQQYAQPAMAQPMAQTAPTPMPTQMPQQVAQTVAAPVAPMAQAAPAAQPAAAPQMETPQTRAKVLLHGKSFGDFLVAAMNDNVVKSDPAFVNTILNQTFVKGLVDSGQAVVQNGVYAVIA